MFEGPTEKELEELIADASRKMVFSRDGKVAYGAAIRYAMLRSEQREREAKKLLPKNNVFLFELPNY